MQGWDWPNVCIRHPILDKIPWGVGRVLRFRKENSCQNLFLSRNFPFKITQTGIPDQPLIPVRNSRLLYCWHWLCTAGWISVLVYNWVYLWLKLLLTLNPWGLGGAWSLVPLQQCCVCVAITRLYLILHADRSRPTFANVVTHISYMDLELVSLLFFYQYSTISKYTHYQNQKGQPGV